MIEILKAVYQQNLQQKQIIFDNMSLEKGCTYPRWKKAMLEQKMFRKNVTKIIREQSPSFLGPKTFFGWETEKDEIDSKFRQIFNFRLFFQISKKFRQNWEVC